MSTRVCGPPATAVAVPAGPNGQLRFRLVSAASLAASPVQLTERIQALYPWMRVVRMERDGELLIADYVDIVTHL